MGVRLAEAHCVFLIVLKLVLKTKKVGRGVAVKGFISYILLAEGDERVSRWRHQGCAICCETALLLERECGELGPRSSIISWLLNLSASRNMTSSNDSHCGRGELVAD